MKASEFRIIGLYIFNSYNYDKFSEDVKQTINPIEESYITAKWVSLQENPMLFLLNHTQILEAIVKRIKNENYKG